jgi:hypothetical protein
MSRGLGFLERKIINMLRYGRRPWPLEADHITGRAYPDDRGSYWSQHVAVLRAMRSVAGKYPDTFVLRGGKGRAPLVIMPAKDAPEWDEEHPPRRRHRKAGAPTDDAALVIIAELEEHLAQAHERIAEHVKHIEDAHARIAERDVYIAELEGALARKRTKHRRKPRSKARI